MDISFVNLFLHLDQYLAFLMTHYGAWIYGFLFAVIYCETGLVVTPFLPGDTLLFVAGAAAATGGMNPFLLVAVLLTAAVLGDSSNYWLGRLVGMKLFSNPDSRLFRRDYLDQAHAFYERHGGKTVILARFVPVVRTFAPFVAGLGTMRYVRFLAFSISGTLVWVGGLVALGYEFGNIEFIRKNLSIIVLAGVAAAVFPVIAKAMSVTLQNKRHG